MIPQFSFYLTLIVIIIAIIMLANRLKIAYPVLLVVAGLILSFIPGVPLLRMDPELIFVIFLPPLLYEAAWAISWKELWRWRRIIGSFAFVVVFLTAMSVAFVANHFIPGFTLALGFLLGGIVSPPDAVSASAILKFVNVPKRMSAILEGESLLNDASSLIIFRFALIALSTGQFIWYQAVGGFAWMIIGGIGIGLLLAWVIIQAQKRLPTDANMDTILTIITPYVIYMVAEEAHSSGVLAVVCGGLLMSNKRHTFLSNTSRLRGVNVWQNIVFVLNGLVFLLIGLDLPEITGGLEGVSMMTAIGYGVLVTVVLIIGRILAAYGAVIVTLIARNFITVADARSPGFKAPLVMGWTGMRGVVSLAAALSIPVTLHGAPFPQRNLILFITFIVILITLLLQGLTLPYLIRKLDLPQYDDFVPEEEAEALIRKGLADHTVHFIESRFGDRVTSDQHLRQLQEKWNSLLQASNEELQTLSKSESYEIINSQRAWLLSQNAADKHFDEELIRKYLTKLDLEEEKLKYS
ncbi:Na+/H+ antiporter [Chitinophaga sp. sic0106]|uniref:Na+/H+ antiporter n=1 Tax=Chitinophaga sp. sic0106 TaxID=2854785 RepID=UPI001C4469D8|nr:Na+/H+ antiporter [Chitinophaga sp. sic0106]MBV7532473.1 Na+/H+ antiporter [Chitinophaga sp. sic0106]